MFADETEENYIELRGPQDFKVNVFCVMRDGLKQELRRILESYSEVQYAFKCVFTNDDNIVDESLNNQSIS